MTEPIQDYYDPDVAKLNALAAKSAARAEELKAENAKLRELCGEMLAYLLPSSKRYTVKEQMAIIDGFAERCSELGIEVSK